MIYTIYKEKEGSYLVFEENSSLQTEKTTNERKGWGSLHGLCIVILGHIINNILTSIHCKIHQKRETYILPL